MPEPCAVGHDELGPRGLKLVAGPHWKPPMYSVLFRWGLPELVAPPPDVLPVPHATSSGPPKASAPPTAVSRRISRLDLREKMLIFSPLLSIAVPWMHSLGGRAGNRRRSLSEKPGRGRRPIVGSVADPHYSCSPSPSVQSGTLAAPHDSRTTSRVGISMCRSISRPSAAATTVRAAAAPISYSGWCTVVSAGMVNDAASVSSKPISDTSSGTRTP